jgi:flagellar biosynthesis protein FlhB
LSRPISYAITRTGLLIAITTLSFVGILGVAFLGICVITFNMHAHQTKLLKNQNTLIAKVLFIMGSLIMIFVFVYCLFTTLTNPLIQNQTQFSDYNSITAAFYDIE